MLNPDGSAVQVHRAVWSTSRWGLVRWGLVGLMCWPVALLVLVGILLVSTHPVGPRRPSLRMATRIALLVAVAGGLLAVLIGSAWGELLGFGALLLVWPLFWGHLLALTRPGSRLRTEVLLVGVVISGLGASAMLFLSVGGMESAITGGIVGLLTLASALPGLLWVMGRYWQASQVSASEASTAIRRQCKPLGFVEAPWGEGMWLMGHRKGRRVEVRLDTRRAPCEVVAEALLPEWPAGAVARVRMAGETGGDPLSDPLLSRLLCVSGLPDADRVLAGLHEPLLALLHAWPGSQIRDGRIQVVMPGPPFAPGPAGEALQTPRWMGVFVLEQLTGAVTLADQLASRLVPAGPSSIHGRPVPVTER